MIMELDDCFPHTRKVMGTSDLAEGFKDANWALWWGRCLVALEWSKDLLGINGTIFTGQGKAINDHVAEDVRVLVVGNPCNTNALIAMNAAKDIPNDRFFAMTRLDENRAKSQLATKSGVHHSKISNMCVWGNHSATHP